VLEIQESTSSKKQKWVKKWEPHKHCQVCGLAMEIGKDFCSSKCMEEYNEWKTEKEKKDKRNNRLTMVLMVGMIAVMFFVLMFSQ